jgi:hypothetical protein
MMNELYLYVEEKVCRDDIVARFFASLIASYRPVQLELQTKDGKEWDGNVPTNYSHKGTRLGRWINRQRSLCKTGNLKKDRQKELEDIGLRWQAISITPWDDMYDTLREYVKEREAADPNNYWDGNVPADHKTKDNPPKALGRWINRQRCAYGKGELEKEFVDRLNAIGLQWSARERNRLLGPIHWYQLQMK